MPARVDQIADRIYRISTFGPAVPATYRRLPAHHAPVGARS